MVVILCVDDCLECDEIEIDLSEFIFSLFYFSIFFQLLVFLLDFTIVEISSGKMTLGSKTLLFRNYSCILCSSLSWVSSRDKASAASLFTSDTKWFGHQILRSLNVDVGFGRLKKLYYRRWDSCDLSLLGEFVLGVYCGIFKMFPQWLIIMLPLPYNSFMLCWICVKHILPVCCSRIPPPPTI